MNNGGSAPPTYEDEGEEGRGDKLAEGLEAEGEAVRIGVPINEGSKTWLAMGMREKSYRQR